VSCCPTNVARTLASVALYFATASDDGIQLHQYGDYEVSTQLAAGAITLQVASDYPVSGAVVVTVIEAPPREITLRLRVPAWADGAVEVSERPTARTRGHVEIRRVFQAGQSVRVTFPAVARATYPDPRIDSARGAFAVERGPLVLVLESVDLPRGWSVNEITADPQTILTGDGGTTIDAHRQVVPSGGWPYFRGQAGTQADRARVRLIPYHDWANRGPATMRAWLPLAQPQRCGPGGASLGPGRLRGRPAGKEHWCRTRGQRWQG
jgi:uncharacterized protein